MADSMTRSHERLKVRGFVALLIFGGAPVAAISGCNHGSQPASVDKAEARNLYVGSAIVGEGNELAAIDVIVGDKSGPVGAAFASGLANQRQGHPAIVVVLQPNMAVKPSTLLITRVTLTGEKASVQFFDPVQQGVSRAIVDSIAEKVIPRDKAEELAIIVSVFIHAQAEDKPKLFQNNYEAAKLALRRAIVSEPSVEEIEKVRRRN